MSETATLPPAVPPVDAARAPEPTLGGPPTDDAPLLPLRELVRLVWHDFRRAFTPLVVFEAGFKALALLVVLPGLYWALSALLEATGRHAVSNIDLVAFFLSPAGIFYAALFGVITLGLWLLEHAGVMTVVVLNHLGLRGRVRGTLSVVAFALPRILRLGLAILAASLLALAPFAGLALLTKSLLLGERDMNYYLARWPPEFVWACVIGGVLGLGVAVLAGYLYVRWVFALAILIYEDRQPIPALHESARRTKGIRLRVGGVLLGWHLVGLVVSALLLLGFRALAGAVLDNIGHKPAVVIPTVALLLVVQFSLLAVLSFLAVTGHCLLILRLYGDRSVRLGLVPAGKWVPHAVSAAPPTPYLVRRWWLAGVGLAAAVLVCCMVIAGLDPGTGKVEITAHRGHSSVAPDNTMAAFKAAVGVADYVELDVHLCTDGELAVLHDYDLARVTRNRSRAKIYKARYADIAGLDVGSHFSPAFADERVPTLRQVIAQARGRIKLNNAQKCACDDPGLPRKEKTSRRKRDLEKEYELARRVAELIAEMNFEKECVVMSNNHEGVLYAKKYNPAIRTGYIVTPATIGDPTRVPVDVLSIEAKMATDRFLRRARRRGKEVHVWTVNDKNQMRQLIERGIRNIITDKPDLLKEVRDHRNSLSGPEQMLLAYRYLLEL